MTKSLVRCSLHFQANLTEIDYEIYLQGLSDIDEPDRIAVAIDRAMKNSEFMPKLATIRSELPRLEEMPSYKPEPTIEEPHCRIIKEWYENFSSTARAHWFEFEDGTSKLRLEKL